MMRNVVVLWLLMATWVAEAQISKDVVIRVPPVRYFIHVANDLTNQDMFVHCQSKDDDLRIQHLVHRGDEFRWNFKENFWKTTLFWCRLEKSDAHVSFNVFWPESKHHWLRDRCGSQGVCIWSAKDDGIYLRNLPAQNEEFVHKWIII
ncbi:hypothetical protein IC582_000645 [Cucumis melo]